MRLRLLALANGLCRHVRAPLTKTNFNFADEVVDEVFDAGQEELILENKIMSNKLKKVLSYLPMMSLALCLLPATAPAHAAGHTSKSKKNDFSVNGFTVLHTFAGAPSDGFYSQSALIEDSTGNLYGTTEMGGSNTCVGGTGGIGPCVDGYGTVFEFTNSGTMTVLYNFTGGSDGAYPYAPLVFDSAGNLYGTASGGGTAGCSENYGCGTVFELSPPAKSGGAWTFTTLYTFTGLTDGGSPRAGLTFDKAGNLYGTTITGTGTSTSGTLFELSPPATSGGTWTLATLHGWNSVNDPSGNSPWNYGYLAIDASNNVYGTTYGITGDPPPSTISAGELWEYNPVTTKITNLHYFGSTDGDGYCVTSAPMFDASGNLLGTAGCGGNYGSGIVWEYTTTGVYMLRYNFGANETDGISPTGRIALDSAGNIYGITTNGGNGTLGGTYDPYPYLGTLFKLSPSNYLQTLYDFNTNDGAQGEYPEGGVLLASDGNLYGTTPMDSGTPSRGTLWGYNAVYTTLSVTLTGTGNGTVTSNPSGIDCTTGTCSGPFAPNAVVTLTEAPATGSIFGGWSGANCSGTSTTCQVTLSAAASVTATFTSTVPETTTTTVSSSPNPSQLNQTVTYTATVTAQDATPTGSVTFTCACGENGSTITMGTATLSSGVATLNYSLPAGNDIVYAAYSGNSSFASSSGHSFQIVTLIPPNVYWPTPAPIYYGTVLSKTQQDAKAYVPPGTTTAIPGTYTYYPPAGTLLSPGTWNLQVNFAPASSASATYSSAVDIISITVKQDTITWKTPKAVTYGTALSSTQLDAKANVKGTFSYTPPAGTYLTGGLQRLSVAFTPKDGTVSESDSVPLTVNPVGTSTAITSATSTTNPLQWTVDFTVTPKITGLPAAPTEYVIVTASSGETCSAALAANDTGSCTLTFTASGKKTLTAAYEGDNNYSSSKSKAVSVTVQ
jgi:hypothetical protein